MVLDRLLRAGEGRIVRKLARIADQVNAIETDYLELTDAELREETDTLKARIADGEDLDALLPEAFATVREAGKRVLGMRHFDVQLMGGAALHLGNIAEMKTGEGKTLVGTLPAYLNALSGKGVHLVTTNDYLARRDAEEMGRIHRFLGLEVGVIDPGMRPDQRRLAYACDITYGTNNEFGFDYLRDNMAWAATELVQRGHNYAIVDEVDSILVDEARTPLIISGPAEQSAQWYTTFARLSLRLLPDRDYEVDEGKRTIAVTEEGVERVEDHLGVENLYESINTPLVGYLQNALRAKELYKRDKDYIVSGGEVLIVDEFTGRTLAGRRYSEGMHQAIEAKEGVEIKDENQTLATITLQNYFRLYDKLAGMTGTAMTEAAEFDQIYKLGVVPIPTNRPMVRADEPDVVYKTELAKFEACVADIKEAHEKGQPVLVGTTSVEKSEVLSTMLLRTGVPHEVLNAKYHEREAVIIAQAGRKGAVTVATNMAGRGTDIKLGGNAEYLAAAELRARGLDPTADPEGYDAAWEGALAQAKAVVDSEHDEVVEAGGLYVLGTERHESRRIDNQLRGRAGRQGDPGLSRFYLSLGDDLMRLFNASAVEGIMTRLAIPEDVPIESKLVSRAIRSAQTQVEQQNFERRKNVLKYDDVINRQRQVIYAERRRVLDGEDLSEQVSGMIDDTVVAYVTGATSDGYPEDWNLEELWTGLKQLWPVSYSWKVHDEGREQLTAAILIEDLQTDAHEAYARREAEFGAEGMRELERRVVLSVLDRKWREHLYEMDYLQEGIGLRGYGQRDPLVEYQREGYDMFVAMMEGIKEEAVGFLYNLEVQVEEQAPAEPEALAFTGNVGQLGEMADAPAELLGVIGAAPHAEHALAAFEGVEVLDPNDPLAPHHVGDDAGTAAPAGAPAAQAPVAPLRVQPDVAPAQPAQQTGIWGQPLPSEPAVPADSAAPSAAPSPLAPAGPAPVVEAAPSAAPSPATGEAPASASPATGGGAAPSPVGGQAVPGSVPAVGGEAAPSPVGGEVAPSAAPAVAGPAAAKAAPSAPTAAPATGGAPTVEPSATPAPSAAPAGGSTPSPLAPAGAGSSAPAGGASAPLSAPVDPVPPTAPGSPLAPASAPVGGSTPPLKLPEVGGNRPVLQYSGPSGDGDGSVVRTTDAPDPATNGQPARQQQGRPGGPARHSSNKKKKKRR